MKTKNHSIKLDRKTAFTFKKINASKHIVSGDATTTATLTPTIFTTTSTTN